MRVRKLLLLLSATGLTLTACGGGDDDDSAQDDAAGVLVTPVDGGDATTGGAEQSLVGEEAVDVCAIVSREEAAQALGMAVLEGEYSVANFDQATCRWPSESDFGEISVEVRSGDPARFTEFYESVQGDPVDGLGDRAQWDPTLGVLVLTADYMVWVSPINLTDDQAVVRERAIALAQQVLARLP